jgi:hypothetical protein
MAKKTKKIFKGIVVKEFKVGYQSGIVTYKVGDTFETENIKSLQYLINIKNIK